MQSIVDVRFRASKGAAGSSPQKLTSRSAVVCPGIKKKPSAQRIVGLAQAPAGARRSGRRAAQQRRARPCCHRWSGPCSKTSKTSPCSRSSCSCETATTGKANEKQSLGGGAQRRSRVRGRRAAGFLGQDNSWAWTFAPLAMVEPALAAYRAGGDRAVVPACSLPARRWRQGAGGIRRCGPR